MHTVPGTLWLPPAAEVPPRVVLIGHGGSGPRPMTADEYQPLIAAEGIEAVLDRITANPLRGRLPGSRPLGIR